jgi:hypothetical protein
MDMNQRDYNYKRKIKTYVSLNGNQNLYIEEQITQSAKRKNTKGQPMTYKTYT